MATFRCERYPNITLQDESGIWARFSGGEFVTDDKVVAERLRHAEDVVEVDADKPARRTRAKAAEE